MHFTSQWQRAANYMLAESRDLHTEWSSAKSFSGTGLNEWRLLCTAWRKSYGRAEGLVTFSFLLLTNAVRGFDCILLCHGPGSIGRAGFKCHSSRYWAWCNVEHDVKIVCIKICCGHDYVNFVDHLVEMCSMGSKHLFRTQRQLQHIGRLLYTSMIADWLMRSFNTLLLQSNPAFRMLGFGLYL